MPLQTYLGDDGIGRRGEEHASAGDEERQRYSVPQQISTKERTEKERNYRTNPPYGPRVAAAGHRRVRGQAGQCEGKNGRCAICNMELPNRRITQSH